MLGPESSGTRLLTGVLIAGGCAGEVTHRQRFDELPPHDAPYVVWRRSAPHARSWPDVEGMVGTMREQGYRVVGVVTTRDWMAMCHSQISRGHSPTVEAAERRIRTAYAHIFGHLTRLGVEFITVSYEGLVQRPEATFLWLKERLGLPRTPVVKIRDSNARYYRQYQMR
ncbi:MAG: hypothetical protein JXA14_26075 [Anaerolineae bacterium]|nr:hypothetical protein [Anaerolineae bacterium]